jgi:hypothetical protein
MNIDITMQLFVHSLHKIKIFKNIKNLGIIEKDWTYSKNTILWYAHIRINRGSHCIENHRLFLFFCFSIIAFKEKCITFMIKWNIHF